MRPRYPRHGSSRLSALGTSATERLTVSPFTVSVRWVTLRLQLAAEQAEFLGSFPPRTIDGLGTMVAVTIIPLTWALKARERGKTLCAGSREKLAITGKLVELWGGPPDPGTSAPFEVIMEEKQWKDVEWTAAAMGLTSGGLVRAVLKEQEEGLLSLRQRQNEGEVAL